MFYVIQVRHLIDSGLLAKLSWIDVTDGLLKWFENYLSDRQQTVVINDQASEWAKINISSSLHCLGGKKG